MYRLTNDPFEEYFKLHRIQQRIAEDQGDKASLLTVMYHWHDMPRDGSVVSLAAECQNKGGVTGVQVQYAFLRGAARQFGISLAGDVSVFTSWDKQLISTALRRRFLYSEFQWNCAILSCEDAYGPSSIVLDFNRWMQGFLDKVPRPGPVHCPVAFLTDPFQGWMPSQALSLQFLKHGHQAYGQGDFLTHHLFSMVYPHYEDNGIYKNESRALVPTPYGDIVEVVTTDCPANLFNGYGVIVAASDLPDAGAELRDRLNAFVTAGGHLVITAANARRLFPEWKLGPEPVRFDANTQVELAPNATVREPLAFEAWVPDLSRIAGARVTASAGGKPLVCQIPQGKGRITLLASPYGLNRDARPMVARPYPLWNQKLDASTDQAQPYSLLKHVRLTLDSAFREQTLFTISNDNLAFIVNRLAADEFLVGIYNSQLSCQQFAIGSRIGPIASQAEIPLDSLREKYPFLPAGYSDDGKSGDLTHIAAGDVRFFRVQIAPTPNAIRVAPAPALPPRPKDRFLRMPTLADLERNLVKWPTFFQHFDGVMLDWTQFRDIDREAFSEDDARWLNRQQLRFVVDLRSGRDDHAFLFDISHLANARQTLLSLAPKLALLNDARDLLTDANSPAELDGLRTLASDPGFAAFRFHVIPRNAEALGALRANPGKLLIASGAVQTDLATSKNRMGLLVLASGVPMDFEPTAGLPGIQVLDAVYNDWAPVYLDVQKAWEHPSRGVLSGSAMDRAESGGMAQPWAPNTYLSLRDPGSIERALKQFDPIWRRFAGVKLESTLVWKMSPEACAHAGQALKRRRLKVMIDFSDALEGWTGWSFQDSRRRLATPEIGVRARSKRAFENIAAKLPLLGVTDALFVVSHATNLGWDKETPLPETSASRAVFDAFCQLLRAKGVTGHLWHRPHRVPSETEFRKLVDETPGLKVALNLNANADLAKALARAGDKLGAIVIGGGTRALAERNAIQTSSPFSGIMYGPLSWSPDLLGKLPSGVPWIFDGDYHNAREIQDDLSKFHVGN